MRRRDFVLGSIAMLAASRTLAQPLRTRPKVGVLLAQRIPNAYMEAFRSGLQELGYVEGKNILVEYRSVDSAFDRYPAMARELAQLQVDVIVAGGGAAAVRAAKQATATIPIVFPASRDPVDEGFVQSLARPGGNITGTSILESQINAKRVELTKQLLPRARRVAVLFDLVAGPAQVGSTELAARALGIELRILQASKPEEIDKAFADARNGGAEALIVSAAALFAAHRNRLIALAAEHRLATVWEHRQFTHAGGLLSYGPDIADLYRSAARYVDKILKGAKPAELPVEQATKLELVINMQTARAQGIAVPNGLLARADEVIQ